MTSRYTRLVSRWLFPLHERLKGHSTYDRLSALEQSQWLSPQQLERLQQEKLQAFIRQILTEVPYYQQVFKQFGLTAADIRNVGDLHKLPLLDKALIRSHSQQLFSIKHYRFTRGSTGGSSGQPLTFYMDQHRVSHDVAAKLRATRWWGVDIGDPEAVIWGAPIELGKQSWLKSWRDKIFRSVLMPALTLTPELVAAQLQQLQQQKPAMIFGYPSVIYQLCLAAKRHQTDLGKLGVKVVFVTSEMLYPHERDTISQSFQCPVANGYGARDAGFIAHECPAGKMHISAEDIIVELLDERGQPVEAGQTGEIVVTHLATPGFPFIRYCTGDLAQLDPAPCPCGRGLTVLANVQGRRRDFLLTTTGHQLHSWGVVYLLRDLTDIKKFKVIQHQPKQIELLVVADQPLSTESQMGIRRNFRHLLGDDMNVSINHVPDIPAAANGKYCYVENRLEFAVRRDDR